MSPGLVLALSLLASSEPGSPRAHPGPEPLAAPAGSRDDGGAPGARGCAAELFRIARSKNANEVVYSARVAREGELDGDDPLVAEWHMLAEDGHREGLNFVEKLFAYGFSVDPVPGGDGYLVVLKAKKDRPVHLAMREGCPAALVTISGKEALLRRIFVATTEGGLFPQVAWADLDGVDPTTGHPIRERIFPPASNRAGGYGEAKGHLP